MEIGFRMIKAVLFDIDNTLLNFDQCVKDAMREGFAKYELPPYKDYMFDAFTLINNEIWKQFERGEIDFQGILKTRWQKIFDTLNIAFDGYTFEKYFVEYIFHSHIIIEGTEELLNYLSSRYILCVASNGPEKQQLNRLQEAGLLEYFQSFFISETMGVVKPEKGFFEQVVAKLNESSDDKILPEEIMIIGDSLSSDIVGGKNNGFSTCYYNFSDGPVVGEVIPDYTVNSLKEIQSLL